MLNFNSNLVQSAGKIKPPSTDLRVGLYMEIHVYNILAKKDQKEEKKNQPPQTQYKQTNTHTHTKRTEQT